MRPPAQAGRENDVSVSANIVAILNQKGGVGKTSVTLGLAEALALQGHRVLMVDCDPQSNLAACLGEYEVETGLEAVYDEQASLLDLTFETEVKNLFLVPSTAELVNAEQRLVAKPNRDARLSRALSRAFNASQGQYAFDYVFLDCPPSRGLLTTNALYASRFVIIPTELSVLGVKGINSQFGAVHSLNEAYDHAHPTEVLGILLNRVDRRQRVENRRCLETLEQAVAAHPELLFDAQIRVCEDIRHAQSAGTPIATYDPASRGAFDFRTAATEVATRVAAR